MCLANSKLWPRGLSSVYFSNMAICSFLHIAPERHNNEAPTSSSCCHNFLLHWNVILVSTLPLGVGIISSTEAMCADIFIVLISSAITTRSLVHKQLVAVPSLSLEIMIAARALGDQQSAISNNTSGDKVVSSLILSR